MLGLGFGSLHPGDFIDQWMPGRRIPFVESFRKAIGDDLPDNYFIAADWSGPLDSIWNVCLMRVDIPEPHPSNLGYSIADARNLAKSKYYTRVFDRRIREYKFDDLVNIFKEEIKNIDEPDRKYIAMVQNKPFPEAFKYHVIPVVQNALLLGKKYYFDSTSDELDLEVIRAVAYLHDIGAVDDLKNYTPDNDHHIIGAQKAREILESCDCYSEEFISRVEHCVLAHRGRSDPKPETLEAQIIACADAIAHFDAFLDLFRMFLETCETFEQAVKEVEQKMKRDWEIKLTLPEAKEMCKEKYEAIMLIIKSMKEYI